MTLSLQTRDIRPSVSAVSSHQQSFLPGDPQVGRDDLIRAPMVIAVPFKFELSVPSLLSEPSREEVGGAGQNFGLWISWPCEILPALWILEP